MSYLIRETKHVWHGYRQCNGWKNPSSFSSELQNLTMAPQNSDEIEIAENTRGTARKSTIMIHIPVQGKTEFPSRRKNHNFQFPPAFSTRILMFGMTDNPIETSQVHRILTIWAPASTAEGNAKGSTEETQICKNKIIIRKKSCGICAHLFDKLMHQKCYNETLENKITRKNYWQRHQIQSKLYQFSVTSYIDMCCTSLSFTQHNEASQQPLKGKQS